MEDGKTDLMNKYIIPGQPIPLQRPRFYNGHVIDSQRSEKLHTATYIRFLKVGPITMLEGPIHLTLTFFMKKPKKGKKIWHSSRPDLDNLVKFILDVCNGVLYKDDAQVAKITTEKIYDDEPRTEIYIEELG